MQNAETTIYLIRHGEVQNPKGTLYGRLPGFGLSERGKQQVTQTGEFLKNKHIDFIYSSPMLRAKQTTAIIQSITGLTSHVLSKSILEVRTSFQGQPFASLSHDQAELYTSPKRAATDETIEQIAKRMYLFIQKLVRKHAGKHIVVVGHGDPIMILKARLQNLPLTFESIRKGKGFSYIKHGEVLELQIENGEVSIKSIFKPEV